MSKYATKNQSVQSNFSEIQSARRNLNLTIFESSITAGLLCMAIMTPFFKSIGLSQTEISLTQIIFTIVALILDFPAGWLADRLSRKMANVIGDFGMFVILIYYSRITNFWGAVICESLMGFFMALSQGVDKALIRHFSSKISSLMFRQGLSTSDLDRQIQADFHRYSANTEIWRNIAVVIISLLGGPIGAISFRLAISLSGITYLLGGVASLFLVDDSPKLEPIYQNPFKDMARIFGQSLKNHQLMLRILAYVSSREATHAIVWVFTPLLLYAGVPLEIVSVAWVIKALACMLGAGIAKKYAMNMQDYQKIAFPTILIGASMLIMSIKINFFTVCLYGLLGIVQGWTAPALLPPVQEHVSKNEQTTVVSLAHTFGKACYIITSLITGICADIDLRLVPLVTFLIFVPFGFFATWRLYHEKPPII